MHRYRKGSTYTLNSQKKINSQECGKLNYSMYGTRDAAQNWMDTYCKFMVDIGFVKGKASPCAFWHPRRELRSVVHGDDFTNLGHEHQSDWFKEEIAKKFDIKYRGRIGPGRNDEKEMKTSKCRVRLLIFAIFNPNRLTFIIMQFGYMLTNFVDE